MLTSYRFQVYSSEVQ